MNLPAQDIWTQRRLSSTHVLMSCLAGLIAFSALALTACGEDESEPAVAASALETAIQETVIIPAADPSELTVSCELDEGDGLEDRWDCAVQTDAPVTDAEERKLRMSFPNDRGLRADLAVWIASDRTDDEFPAGSFAGVQVGGDPLFEGGGATTAGGCCVEPEE